MAGDAFLRALDGLDDVPLELLVRPLVKLDVEASARAARAVVMRFSLKLETGEASARVEMLRRSPPLPWVAPRACAKSARLMARCGGVWRAMATSLPQGTHRALVSCTCSTSGITKINLHADL
eukprot:scaffold73035_cov68-Phaeocystis_antarctica.AAC.8